MLLVGGSKSGSRAEDDIFRERGNAAPVAEALSLALALASTANNNFTSTIPIMTIFLYAEHLLNIRAISIQAILPSSSNKNTRATLSNDGSHMSLYHEGETTTIQLPVHVQGDHNGVALTIPANPSTTLSFRVQLRGNASASINQEEENILPWSAHTLTTTTQISCVHCQEILVHRGKVTIWKDLPSENWAEMMDFWHCHRPHVPHDHDHEHAALAKGYSADSTLALSPGVGMVDPVDFVLTSEDCSNLKVGFSHLFLFSHS